MLTPRLLIVGVFAVVCAWLPGNLAADEPEGYKLPAGYTLDLFCTPPLNGYNNFFAPPPRQPTMLELSLDRGRSNWDPIFIGRLGGNVVQTLRPPVEIAGLKDGGLESCDHCCPLCQSPLPKAEDAAEYVPEEPAEVKLREGEPAKVLLQAMKQVRPSILDGTIFQDSRPIDDAEAMPLEGEGSAAIIVRCIRNLEAQADRHRLPEGTACVSSSPAPAVPPAVSETTPEAVAALRQAGRDLEETANMLEERGLYDQADHLRAVAQEMRIQARATNASSQSPVSYAPMPMPGPGADDDELAGDKDLERREPKLRYDGDCDDQD